SRFQAAPSNKRQPENRFANSQTAISLHQTGRPLCPSLGAVCGAKQSGDVFLQRFQAAFPKKAA
ncbi:hypothetical protein, partial [Kingella oralis]|uniref:hypothetical protein n=1 Tax=Kingella oralis TaxID=505 RepID=UPI0034E5F089